MTQHGRRSAAELLGILEPQRGQSKTHMRCWVRKPAHGMAFLCFLGPDTLNSGHCSPRGRENKAFERVSVLQDLGQLRALVACRPELRADDLRSQPGPPSYPFKPPQIPSNRDHKAISRGALRGLGWTWHPKLHTAQRERRQDMWVRARATPTCLLELLTPCRT